MGTISYFGVPQFEHLFLKAYTCFLLIIFKGGKSVSNFSICISQLFDRFAIVMSDMKISFIYR